MTTITGYNASPPSDDGSQTEANKVKWSTITGKIGDPLNDFLAAFHEDQTGSLSSTGSSNAYLLTSTLVYTALADIPLIVFKANHANTGAATIAVDGLTAKTIKKNHDQDLASGDIEVNQIVVLAYNVTDDTFELVSQLSNAADLSLYAALATANEFTATQNFNATTLTSTTNSVAWDASANQVVTHTLTENTTFAAPSNLVDGAFYNLCIVQDASASGYTVAYNAVFKFPSATAPTLTTTASARDYLTFRSNGTNLYLVGVSLDVS